MAARDYETAPAAETLGVKDIIMGLAEDLKELRAAKISTNDALARAAIAKQIFNGIRLYLQASKFLEGVAPPEAINALPSAGDIQQ